MLNCQTILQCCVVFHLKTYRPITSFSRTSYIFVFSFLNVALFSMVASTLCGWEGSWVFMHMMCALLKCVCVYIYNDNLWILSLQAGVSVIWSEFEAAAFSYPSAFVSALAISCCDICESSGASLYAGMWIRTYFKHKHHICAHVCCYTVLHTVHHMWISCV